MFGFIKDINNNLKEIKENLIEIKLILLIYRGIGTEKQVISESPTDKELKKEGMIINPSLTRTQKFQEELKDFYSYHGDTGNSELGELLDASELSSK